MALTRASKVGRTNSTGNPITQSVTITTADRLVVLLLKTVGSGNRAGGSPLFNGVAMTQANSTQKAAASPECSAEIWYFLNPLPGTYNLVIPNTGSQSIFYTIETAQVPRGAGTVLVQANGGNATSTNPTPGAVTVREAGCLAWAIVASGAQTWAPSAQAGTNIANTDDGADGGGEQYSQGPALGSLTLNWTFGTSDDYGAVVALFGQVNAHNFENYKGVRADDGVCVTGGKIR